MSVRVDWLCEEVGYSRTEGEGTEFCGELGLVRAVIPFHLPSF